MYVFKGYHTTLTGSIRAFIF